MVLVLSSIVAVVRAGAAEPANLVANGDFSQVTDTKPDNWSLSGDPKTVVQTIQVGRDETGRSFAKLVCTRCDRAGGYSHAMLAQVGMVRLRKGGLYEFSCRVRAEGLAGRTVGVAIQETNGWLPTGFSEQLPVSGSWREHKRLFTASRDVGPTGRLQIWFTEPGTLCIADVRIVECSQQTFEFTDLAPAGTGKNLLFNGSFELGGAGWSSLGSSVGWGNMARLHGRVETGGGAHGRSFLRIPLGPDTTPVLGFDYYEPVVRRETRPLAASRGWIQVEKGEAYTLSCQMRANLDGAPAVLGARAKDPAGRRHDHRQSVKLTRQWQRYSLTFRPGFRYVFVFVGPDLPDEQRVDVDIDTVQLEKGDRATGYQPQDPVEFAMEPSRPAGIFVQGEPATLVLRACNHSGAAARVAVRFTATDFWDQPVPLADRTLELPPGQTVQSEILLPADSAGFYRVRASAETGCDRRQADIRLAIVPKRTAGDSVCGINHAFADPFLIDLAAKAGVSWYRDWSLKWQHIEPVKGQFRWESGDAQIDRVLHRSMHVLPLLPPFPSSDWASEAPAGLPTTGYPGARLRQAWAPKEPGDLAAFIEQAVARYKDRVKVWEFLNEPIYTSYALPADRENRYGGRKYAPADYVALLQRAAGAMKKADPACKIIGGIGGGPRTLTTEVIQAGCLRHVDMFNLHIYPGARVPESHMAEMDELLAVMERHGGRKPIWMTEFSYYATDDLPRRPFFPMPSSWSEHRLLESERQCADYTGRFFLVMLSRGVHKVFIHSGAGGEVNNPSLECALFDYGGMPRKLFAAMAVLTELLGGAPVCAGYRRLGQSGHAVAFETAGRSVLAVWREEEDLSGRLAPTGLDGLTWLNAMGGKVSPGPPVLSTSPAYLLGPAGKAPQLLASLRVLPGE